ncbi:MULTISPECIES: DUF4435 domain-containing protein [unclassified Coleofasciculus]|uniref:DUF4435 domain-containing protein n=1 Tax=unclassified Coleofasciculus TaxID=2692782 RepID=UPI001881E28E|nr:MULTISPECIES: DUF4435 domain-containing protein [unclassified Coleofasciculus]MBE9127281.1 DUF4435 domain-containing protein [Coleofasciculus sp. LEGE 07081]MBE9150567.1 DUF4435 domain-containing protein [Coleofasciculus sp. LEGE 07092]
MSVVSSSKVIFCEGKQKSLDTKLLERVLETMPVERPTIVPSGGKFTFSVFAQGYFFPNETVNQRYIVFRDRDFDTEPTTNIQLLKWQRQYLTYRACVENYLLDVDLIHRYWVDEYTNTVTQDRFEESLATYQNRFAQEEFWVQRQYLNWFHGKDIRKAMQKQQSQYISLYDSFCNWAIAQLDITQYPELMELRTKIEEL